MGGIRPLKCLNTYQHTENVRKVLLCVGAQHDSFSLRVLAFQSTDRSQKVLAECVRLMVSTDITNTTIR